MFEVISNILAKHKLVLTAIASAAVSSAATFVITKNVLGKAYEERFAVEAAETKRFYNGLYKRSEFETIESTTEVLGLINEYRSDEEQAEAVDVDFSVIPEDVTYETVFDYDSEVATRTPGKPYVITDEEFNDNETGYTQVSLTYYDGDDVLSDDRDQIVADVDRTVGIVNLSRFGHGSNDDRIVYVRNDKLEIEIEVSLHDGDYAEVVHGIIKEEPKRKPRKPRGDDG